jgi:hypothetical protein
MRGYLALLSIPQCLHFAIKLRLQVADLRLKNVKHFEASSYMTDSRSLPALTPQGL